MKDEGTGGPRGARVVRRWTQMDADEAPEIPGARGRKGLVRSAGRDVGIPPRTRSQVALGNELGGIEIPEILLNLWLLAFSLHPLDWSFAIRSGLECAFFGRSLGGLGFSGTRACAGFAKSGAPVGPGLPTREAGGGRIAPGDRVRSERGNPG